MNRFLQLFTMMFAIVFILLYTYMTQPIYDENVIWCLLSLLLLAIGWALQPQYSVLAAIGAVLVYCVFQYYFIYTSGSADRLDWNALIWLLVFPFAALLGATGKQIRAASPEGTQTSLYELFRSEIADDPAEIIYIDEKLDFFSASAFVFKLEEEVISSLREKREFVLLIVSLYRFGEYKKVAGFDQSQLLIHQIAEWIADKQNSGEILHKGHLGEGNFALILPISSDNREAEYQLEAELNHYFMDLMMHRPRREAQVKVRLVYGSAICPADGIEARALMDHAQSMIEGNVSQS
jgi:GGDEF domain-containing protein